MVEYDRIDISEGIDVSKTNCDVCEHLLKKCDICHSWYFKNIGFKYESIFVMAVMI